MLASELSPSVVVGFTCEACATEGEMIEHPAIETAPQILTVLLNRIDFDRASQRPVRHSGGGGLLGLARRSAPGRKEALARTRGAL
jgi:hypothetical protein